MFWHSLVAEHTKTRSCLFMSSSHDGVSSSGVFHHPSTLLSSVCTTVLEPHGGDVFLCAPVESNMNRLFFCTGAGVYFLILCNEDQILSLLAEGSEEECVCVVPCVCVYLFRFF